MKKEATSAASPDRGIDKLKDLIKFIILAIQKTATMDADGNGKVSLLEGLSLVTSLGFKIPGVINAFPEVIAEWRNLSPEELDELERWFAEEFDLPGAQSGRIKALVKEAIAIIIDNYNHVLRIKEIMG